MAETTKMATQLLLIAKSTEVVRDKENKPTKEVQYFLSFQPNHYKLPVEKEVYDEAVVGDYYQLALTEGLIS